ncbi:MAG: glutathione S-transferase [Holophagae bacterium]|nr:MAG: glutathione S-transferase [Holophagae bacterium]
MRYYYHPGSPNCRKVTAVLDLLEVDAERHIVDLPRGEHLQPAFLAINPNGKVPALVDGEWTIWESNAIIIHLAENAGSDLWPAGERRLDILKWMFWEQAHLMYAAGVPFFQRVLKPVLGLGPADEQRVAEALASFRRLAKVLDGQLASRSFLVGDALTLADLAVASNFSYAELGGLPVGEFGNVTRWLAELDKIPAWRRNAPPAFGG